MAKFNSTEGGAYASFSCSCVCGLFLLFLILRHKLLVSGQLKPELFGCKDFFAALLSCLKRETPIVTKPTRAKDKDTELHKGIANYCTFATCFFFLWTCVGFLFLFVSDNFELLQWSVCRELLMVNALSYTTGKNCMYSVLVSRLYLGFKDSVYGYSQRMVYAMYSLIAFWQLTMTVLASVFIRGQHVARYKSTANDAKESGAVKGCDTRMPLWMGTMFVAFDVLFSLTVVYLFTAALKRMLANLVKNSDEMNRAHDRKIRAELFLLPVKYTVITVVAIASTMLAFVIYAFSNIAFFITVDTVVNCVCLLLMTAKWKPVYVVTCDPVLRCVAVTPCFGCADLSHLELIGEVKKKVEIAIAQSVADSAVTGTADTRE